MLTMTAVCFKIFCWLTEFIATGSIDRDPDHHHQQVNQKMYFMENKHFFLFDHRVTVYRSHVILIANSSVLFSANKLLNGMLI